MPKARVDVQGGRRLPREIPQRVLRNDISSVLADVAAGGRVRVTVRGKPVAELVPASEDRTWVPRAEFERIVRDAPLDSRFVADVDPVLRGEP